MTWPTLAECVKGIDVWRGNNPDDGLADRSKGRIDWHRFRQEHPEIGVVVARAAGSTSGPDPDFSWNYDEAQKADFEVVGAYVNNNPAIATTKLVEEWWKPTIGTRQPAVIWHDSESPKKPADAGITPARMTVKLREERAALVAAFASSRIDTYSASWWYTPNVIHGWEGGIKTALAHYPFFVQQADGTWRQAFTFEEADGRLPIGNTFTPAVPAGMSIADCACWQCSEYGKIACYTVDGRKISKNIDLCYWRRDMLPVAAGGGPGPGVVPLPAWANEIDDWARETPGVPYDGPRPPEA